MVTAAEQPWLSAGVDTSYVSTLEGSQVTNSGTWEDLNPSPDASMWASVGYVTMNPNGTWAWSYTPGEDPALQTVIVTILDNGVEETTSFYLAEDAAPNTSGIDSLICDPGTLSATVDLWPAFQDREDADAALTFQVVGNSNPDLVVGAQIDQQTGRLTLSFAEDVCDTSTLTIRATDTSGLYVETNFVVVVDPPVYLYWTGNGTDTWAAGTSGWLDDQQQPVAWPTERAQDCYYIAVFPEIQGTTTITVSGTVIVDQMEFESSGYTLDSGTSALLSMGMEGVDTTITVDQGYSATINCPIGGIVEKLGAGTLAIGGNVLDDLTVSEGQLTLADGADIGGNLSIGSGGSLVFDGDSSISGDMTIAGDVGFTSGSVEVAGTINMTGGSGKTTTFSTGAVVTGGLYIQRNMVLEGGTLDLTGGDLELDYYNGGGGEFRSGTVKNIGEMLLLYPGGSVPLSFDKTGPGTLILTGDNTYTGETEVVEGTLQIGDDSENGSLPGDITNNSVLVFHNTTSQSFNGVISGAGSVIKEGDGTLTLTGTNTYRGRTVIDDGVLQLSDNGTFGWDAVVNAAVRQDDEASLVFDFDGARTIPNNIIGAGSIMMTGSGTLTLTGNNTFTGETRIDSGSLVIGARDALSRTLINMKDGDHGVLSVAANVPVVDIGGLTGRRDANFGDAEVHFVGKYETTFYSHLRSTRAIFIEKGTTFILWANNYGCYDVIYVGVDSTLVAQLSCSLAAYCTVYLAPGSTLETPSGYASTVTIVELPYMNNAVPDVAAPSSNSGDAISAPGVDATTGGSTVVIVTCTIEKSCPTCGQCKPPVTETKESCTITVESTAADPDFGLGYGVYDSAAPRLVQYAGGGLAVVFDSNNVFRFTYSGGVYAAAYGAKETLAYDSANDCYFFTTPQGTVLTFHGYDLSKTAPYLLGALKTQVLVRRRDENDALVLVGRQPRQARLLHDEAGRRGQSLQKGLLRLLRLRWPAPAHQRLLQLRRQRHCAVGSREPLGIRVLRHRSGRDQRPDRRPEIRHQPGDHQRWPELERRWHKLLPLLHR